MRLKQGLLVIVAASLFSLSSYASGRGSHYFQSLRYDTNVPSHCQEVSLDHFETHKLETFFYGIEGAEARGFTHEYPLQRNNARKLWSAAQALTMGENLDDLLDRYQNNEEVYRDLVLIAENYEDMGFTFQSEGEILEILAIIELQEDFGDDYYVYGSVFYSDRVAGELDLIVGRVSDCQVEAIGEAKLGVRMLGKAHKQIDRFLNFLRTHLFTLPNFFDLTQYLR